MTQSIQTPQDSVWESLCWRDLQTSDLPQAWALSLAVDWPHRLEDWQFVHTLGRGFAAMDGEQLAGVALCWDFGACATLGQIIVAASHRGRRIGSRLVADALATSPAPSAMLHATEDGAGVYARQGFVVIGEIRQHQGLAVPVAADPPGGAILRAARAQDLDTLAQLDTRANGLSRQALLQALLQVGEGLVLQRGGMAQGFSIARRFGRGQVIGPIVASDAASARALIAPWLRKFAGSFVRIDTPREAELGDWLERAGLAGLAPLPCMVRGSWRPPQHDVQTYGLVSQALA